MKDGDQFGDSMSVFTDWAVVGATNSNSVQGKSYWYKIFLGAWDVHQIIQASDGSKFDYFGGSFSINEKTVVVGAPLRDNGNDPHSGGVYTFTLQGETWTEDKILTTSD